MLRLLIAGVDNGKTFVMDCIKRTLEESSKSKNKKLSGNEICHFPSSLTRGYSEQYFKSLLSEKLHTKFTNGKITKQWRKITIRNEGLDLRVYNYVAYNIISPNLEILEEQIRMGKNYIKNAKQKKQRPRGVVKRGEIYE